MAGNEYQMIRINYYCILSACLTALFFAGVSPASAATSTADLDQDQDGLPDRLEKLFGADPLNADTDGDGYTDRAEVFNGYSPTSTTPARLQKSLYVHLKTQVMEQRVMDIPIATYQISTGKKGLPTPTGTFSILNKKPRAWSRASRLWMPWWMLFSKKGQAIHELPEWPNGKKEGADHLGTPVSHGCVRLGVGPAKLLYDWAPVGMPVVIVSK